MSQDIFRARMEAMRSHRIDETDQEGWVVAYADLITLLFIFFSMLLSVSVVSRTKFEWMTQQFNETASTNLAEIERQLNEQIKKAGLDSQVTAHLSDEGLQIQFSETLLFDTGEAALNTGGATALKGFLGVLGSIPQQYRIAVEGHTDDLPIRTERFESNWSLSAARAVTVLHFLEGQGIARNRLMVRAYADTRPVGVGDGALIPMARAKNRRVALLVY